VGEQLGINGFLGKPIQQSVLFDTLMAVFGQKGTGARPMVTEESLQGQGLKGARVLLAEDNLINQEVAVNILAEVGVQVDVANNGLEALEALRRQAYDSVLMDMQMPEMDGYEAMGVIRQDRRWEGMPIIAMTAHAMQGDRERCLTAGADDYVSKPIDPDRLFATLKRWIRVEEGRAGQVPEPRPRAPAQTDAGVGHPLERLSGFHVPEALGRLRGNEALYCKLLKGFAQDNQDTVERIGAALDSRDLKAAHALVHTLKGVAGNLSALELLQATRALEVDIKAWMAAPQARPETLDERLARVGSRLAQALAAIADAGLMEAPEAGAAGGAAQDRSLTPSTAADLARRIREAVEIGDIMSLDGIAAELPKGSPYGGEITRLAGDFDLDGLERLAQELQERAKGTEI
jgi:CheY-like chemotaxis protein